MSSSVSENTRELLERYHAGDKAALADLITLHYAWLAERVHERLSASLRRDGNTGDYLNEVCRRILETGPKFVADETHFRSLLLRMVKNALIDGGRRMNRSKRGKGKKRRLPTRVSILYLDDSPAKHPTRPDAKAVKAEEESYVELALTLIPPSQRRAIEMHDWEGMTFEQIGEVEGVSLEGARQRFNKGLKNLERLLRPLIANETNVALDFAQEAEDDADEP